MIIGREVPSSAWKWAPIASLYFVPSLNVFPTSMPRTVFSSPPQWVQVWPAPATAMSAINSAVKSRP